MILNTDKSRPLPARTSLNTGNTAKSRHSAVAKKHDAFMWPIALRHSELCSCVRVMCLLSFLKDSSKALRRKSYRGACLRSAVYPDLVGWVEDHSVLIQSNKNGT